MAIIIQEDKKQSNITTIIVAAVVLAVAGTLVYYLFFSPVPIAEQIGTDKFQAVSRFSEARINVDNITGSPTWTAMVRPGTVPDLSPSEPERRENPFESFE